MLTRTRISARARPGALVIFVVISNALISPTLAQRDPDRRVLVDLATLPEPFTNDKLPATGGDGGGGTGEQNAVSGPREKCFSMMGCYEELPITNIPQNPLTMRTEFRLYHGSERETVLEFGRYENCLRSKPDECEHYPFNLQALLDSPFVPSRRTIVVVGGYLSKAPSSWEISLRDLWAQLDDVNVILLCWVGGNSGLYQTAAANTRPVARQLTVLLYYLAKLRAGPELDFELSDDVYTEKFYIIGHSLGAHIAGFVGQDLAGRLGRITGLDPAGPTFDALHQRFRLDRSDAQLVDIMHTNAGAKIFTTQTQYGSALASGHVDLWANDGVHQPGCTNDMLGCSHKRANKYYEAFLNHQLGMRNLVSAAASASRATSDGDNARARRADSDPTLYRLAAYASDNFDEFHNGTSLMRRCPVAALDDADLQSADLYACSVPIDYVAWFDTVRAELRSKHGIDFGATGLGQSSTPVPNNFYFYTSAHSNDQLDHYLVRIRVSKLAYERDDATRALVDGDETAQAARLDRVHSLYGRGGCDVAFDLEMSSGVESSYKIKKYRLLDRLDHLEIVFPFLSANVMSKYELARLDAGDFYVERKSDKDFIATDDMERLRSSLEQIFPQLITARGFNNGDEPPSGGPGGAGTSGDKKKKSKARSFFSSIARLFDRSSGKSADDDAARLEHADCQLALESFSIQPLRKFRRHLSAVFTRDCGGPKRPLSVVLLEPNEASPKIELLNGAADAAACKGAAPSLGAELQPKLSLSTVIIGPHQPIDDPYENPAAGANSNNNNNDDDDLGPEESRLREEAQEREQDRREQKKGYEQEQREEPKTSNSIEEPEGQLGPRRRMLPETRGAHQATAAGGRSSGHLWLLLTLGLLLGLLILALVFMRTTMAAARAPALVVGNPNHASAFAPADIKLSIS